MKNWQILPEVPKEFLKQFPEHNPLLLKLLFNRGIKTQEQIDEFLNPDYQEDIFDPFLLKGMEKAIERIFKAISNKEKIIVYGDYDADGVCSSAILLKTLKKVDSSIDVSCYIPDRKQGHSLNNEAIEEFKNQGVKLIITVDCGISDFEKVELANNLGIDVIITDHHSIPEKLPQAFSIINPKQKDDQYPFKQLAGAGVVFKLVQALLNRIVNYESRIMSDVKGQMSDIKCYEKWLLDLVAIATVADVCPLISENRTLVKYGLIVLNKTKNLGLQALIQEAKISQIDTWNIGFQIGPRLNAGGRMDHADKAFYLLTTDSPTEAAELAKEIETKNRERQNITDKLYQQIREKILPLVDEKKILIIGSENYPKGIIGLLAGKLKDEFSKPAIVIQELEEKGDGSCRSIDGFDIVKTLNKCQDLLENFGGHPKAAGFSIKKEKIPELKKRLEEITELELKDKDLTPKIFVEAKIFPQEISWLMDEQIKLLEPLGEGNKKPIFLIENMEIKNLQNVGNNGKHLKLELGCPSSRLGTNLNFKTIAFNQGKEMENLQIEDKIDVVFNLEIDEWNNRKQLQLRIIDFKKN